ncbi:hypothetical protein LMG24238_01258 [Paraburkholderia sediminicola]|uniref:Uncharacterized protein n=1 Tax=Paraburkholderia sediminicola TaxID=458836 RepID=A0A6J5ACJ4_9BURK|nr:hypothetical protein LMG24238_01258 [Paraburkholderia sediminicola]
MQRCHIGSDRINTSHIGRADEKKALFPRGNRAGQDGRVVQARGCLPTFITITNYQSCCCKNCYCAIAVLLYCCMAVLRCCSTAVLRCCGVAVLRCCGVALQLGPSPSTSPRCNPLLIRAHDCCDRALFALLRLPTALLPCHVGQTRQTAINGTVQNNAGEDRVDGLGDLSLHGKQFM